jgi:ATP-dependent Clp protease ATP-binding subunit ClpC
MRWDEAVVDLLARKGYTPLEGARPVRTLVQQWIEDELTQQVLDGRLKAGQTIVLSVVDDRLVVVGEETPSDDVDTTAEQPETAVAAV